MPMSAVCLFGEAARTGFEIIPIDQRDAVNSRLDVGDHIWTLNTMTPYRMLSRSDEADAATLAILNAETDADYGAFTSRYGPLRSARSYRRGLCSPLAELRQLVADLRRLHAMLLAGGFTEANPPPSGLVMSPFNVAFNLWLLPAENHRGFSPVFSTSSLYCFLCNEIITRSMENRPLLVCDCCGDFHRSARRDKRFCSGKCRTANSRGAREDTKEWRPPGAVQRKNRATPATAPDRPSYRMDTF